MEIWREKCKMTRFWECGEKIGHLLCRGEAGKANTHQVILVFPFFCISILPQVFPKIFPTFSQPFEQVRTNKKFEIIKKSGKIRKNNR